MHPLIAVADLLVGAQCAGCSRPAIDLCRACRVAVRPAPQVVSVRRIVDVPVLAAGDHDGLLRRIVVQWKEQGRDPLTAVLSRHLAAAVVAADCGDQVALVPVPTSRAARRRRGDDLVRRLAREAVPHLASVGVDAVVVEALTRTRRTSDQVGLGATERAANLRGAFGLRSQMLLPSERSLVVVDDVVTTGATGAEAMRALGRAGHAVAAMSVVAATPGLSADPQRGPLSLPRRGGLTSRAWHEHA